MRKGKRVIIEPGITHLPSGRYRVRTAVATGSTKQASASFETLAAAKEALALASALRTHGGDVESALHSLSERGESTLAVPIPAPVAMPAQCRTFAELVRDFQASRKEIMELSDHTLRASAKKGRRSLRPGTFNNNQDIFNNQLLPAFGEMLVSDISREVLIAWLNSQARKGLATSTVGSQLILLKQVVGRARRSEQPDDFPWKGEHPIPTEAPLKKPNQPEKWGGQPGSSEPILPFKEVNLIASASRAAFRPAVYIEAIAALRIGECFGLRLGHFRWDGEFLWISVRRQMDHLNQQNAWTKTDAGYREIPIAPVLAEYLFHYCGVFHSCDLRSPDPALVDRQLIVHPVGRDIDGNRLEALRSHYSSQFSGVRSGVGLDHDILGYEPDTQHLRKGLVTYLLYAQEILRSIRGLNGTPEPIGHEALVVHLRAQIEALSKTRFTGMDVSRYVGHDYTGNDDPFSASPVTLGFYKLEVNSNRAFKEIALAIDEIVRFEIQELCTDLDPEDELPVHFPEDEDWMTSDQAAPLVGLTASNVWTAVKDGRLEGPPRMVDQWRVSEKSGLGGQLANEASSLCVTHLRQGAGGDQIVSWRQRSGARTRYELRGRAEKLRRDRRSAPSGRGSSDQD